MQPISLDGLVLHLGIDLKRVKPSWYQAFDQGALCACGHFQVGFTPHLNVVQVMVALRSEPGQEDACF